MEQKLHLLTCKELAEVLNCSTKHIDNLVHRKLIPCIRVGTLLRFDLDKVISELAT